MTTYAPPFPPQNFVAKSGPVVGAAWLNAIDNLLQGNVPSNGVYTPIFVSGQVQLAGPGGYNVSYGDFLFGLQVPGPGGVGPTLLIGGATKSFAQVVTDEQVPGQKGISLYIAAGEAAANDPHDGGDLWLFGGATSLGKGGAMKIQGGTSVGGQGGDVYILGGNATGNLAPAGNVYLLAGTSGSIGGSVKIYATNLNGNGGDISFWLGQVDDPHSLPLFTMSHTGAFFPGNQGAGNIGDVFTSGGNLAAPTWGPIGTKQLIQLTLSGDTTTTPIGNFFIAPAGNLIFLWTEDLIDAPASGPGDLILTTIPSAYRPSDIRQVPCVGIENNGNVGYAGTAIVDPIGGVTIQLSAVVGNLVTSSSGLYNPGPRKGLQAGWFICYPL